MMKIGVIPDSFQVPFKEAVILARDMGVKGLQPYVTGGEMSINSTRICCRLSTYANCSALSEAFPHRLQDFAYAGRSGFPYCCLLS